MPVPQPPPPAFTLVREGDPSGVIVLHRDQAPVGRLDYRVDGRVIYVDYVEVDPSLRGTGLGARLVEAAVAWARESGRVLVPICGYARSVLRSDARYRDVLDDR
jgi:predicted GNAT family acetyltransferase